MLAAITATPEIALQGEESRKLATALSAVTRHYALPALSPEKMALGVLVWTAGRIYGPRIVAINTRKRRENGGAAHDLGVATRHDPVSDTPQANNGAAWFDLGGAAQH